MHEFSKPKMVSLSQKPPPDKPQPIRMPEINDDLNFLKKIAEESGLDTNSV